MVDQIQEMQRKVKNEQIGKRDAHQATRVVNTLGGLF